MYIHAHIFPFLLAMCSRNLLGIYGIILNCLMRLEILRAMKANVVYVIIYQSVAAAEPGLMQSAVHIYQKSHIVTIFLSDVEHNVRV